MQHLEGEAAVKWLEQEGISVQEAEFLRGVIARGDRVTVDVGDGPADLRSVETLAFIRGKED